MHFLPPFVRQTSLFLCICVSTAVLPAPPPSLSGNLLLICLFLVSPSLRRPSLTCLFQNQIAPFSPSPHTPGPLSLFPHMPWPFFCQRRPICLSFLYPDVSFSSPSSFFFPVQPSQSTISVFISSRPLCVFQGASQRHSHPVIAVSFFSSLSDVCSPCWCVQTCPKCHFKAARLHISISPCSCVTPDQPCYISQTLAFLQFIFFLIFFLLLKLLRTLQPCLIWNTSLVRVCEHTSLAVCFIQQHRREAAGWNNFSRMWR